MDYAIYLNGNGNGVPDFSLRKNGSSCEIHGNGNCNGWAEWSYRQSYTGTECYNNGNCNGISRAFFRRSGTKAFFYDNGNGNGSPIYSFEQKGDMLCIYDNRNCGSWPKWAAKAVSGGVAFYDSGNCNGWARGFIRGADNVRKIASLIQMDSEDNPNIRRIAADNGFSERSFYRHWKKVFSISPARYVMAQKMKRAAWLLTRSHMQIGEIAIMLHFYDDNSFSSTFRHFYGMTPREYRKQNSSS